MILKKIFIFPIRVYQYCISPLFPACCRYYPSCSQYAITAIQRHGVIKGIWLGTKRILRCNPWVEGGYDPVPLKNDKSMTSHNLPNQKSNCK